MLSVQNSPQLRFLNLNNDDEANNDNDDDDDDEGDNLRAHTGISGLRERKGTSKAREILVTQGRE